MQIVRVYSGADGESHFEDIDPQEMVSIAKRLGEGDIQLLSRQAPSFSDYHTAPRRQYVLHLLGTAEYEAAPTGPSASCFPVTCWWPRT